MTSRLSNDAIVRLCHLLPIPERRAQIAAGIGQNCHKVFRDQQAIDGLASFLEQVGREAK
jgi:hypothetical protein